MKVKIEIDTKTFVRFWLVVIGFGLAGLAIYSVRHALTLIAISLFLALVLNRPVAALAKLLPGRSRLGGTALAYIILVAILSGVVWFVIPPIIQQSARFVENVPSMIENASSQWHIVNDFVDKNGLRSQVDVTLDNMKNQASSWAAGFGANIISSIGSLASSIATMFLIVVLSFFMLLEAPIWVSRFWNLYDDQEKMERHKKMVSRMYGVVTGYVSGQLTVSGIDAIISGIVVFIMSMTLTGVDSNLAMLTIAAMFVLTMIPMFGATIGGVLISLLLAFNNLTAGIIYAVYFVIYQQIENNVIAPAIQSKKMEISALTVLVAVILGMYVGGILGILVAIPSAGVVKILLENYIQQAKLRRMESKKPLNKLVKKLKNQD